MKILHLQKIALCCLLVIIFPMLISTLSFQTSTKTAYQIAVENGFQGTEQEWLNSLQGKSAYELAVENGFQGTEQEWLLSLKGSNGKDGKNNTEDSYSMFLKAKANGEITDTTTYIEFLGMIYNSNNEYSSARLTQSLYSSVSIFAYNSKYSNNHSSAGSGVIYKIFDNGDAFILTNYHVV